MDHNSSFQVGIKNCLLASETIVMHRLGDVWFFFFFCIEYDRSKKLGKRNCPILRYCWSHWVLVPSLINGLSVEKEACRPRNVSHFSTEARNSDFLDKPTFLRGSTELLLCKLSLKLCKSWRGSSVVSLKLPLYSHKDKVCWLLLANYVSLYYRIVKYLHCIFQFCVAKFTFKLKRMQRDSASHTHI